MRATTRRETQGHRVAVDIQELMTLLCVGRQTAERIGRESGAGFRVGKRKLYNMQKIQAYVDKLTDERNKYGE